MAFRWFRRLVGVGLGALALWLITSGVVGATEAFGAGAGARVVIGSVLKLIGALAVLGVYWYALWSGSAIRRTLENIFAIPELLRKIIFTLALLCIYRIGFHIPLPGVDQEKLDGDIVESIGTTAPDHGG